MCENNKLNNCVCLQLQNVGVKLLSVTSLLIKPLKESCAACRSIFHNVTPSGAVKPLFGITSPRRGSQVEVG